MEPVNYNPTAPPEENDSQETKRPNKSGTAEPAIRPPNPNVTSTP